MKLNKEECMAVFTMMEQTQVPAKQAAFVASIFDKLDKEIIRLQKLEDKPNTKGK